MFGTKLKISRFAAWVHVWGSIHETCFRPPKKSPVSGHKSALKVDTVTHFFVCFSCLVIFFLANQWNTWYMYTWLLEPDQIGMVTKERPDINRADVHYPMWESRLKHSMAEFQSIQQFGLQLDIVSIKNTIEYHFIEKIFFSIKMKAKNADAWVWDDARADQKPATDFVWPHQTCWK